MTRNELLETALPILFSTDMVIAIIDGRKTQTRRPIKPQPILDGRFWKLDGAGWSDTVTSFRPVPCHSLYNLSKYEPEDILWVKEADDMLKEAARIFLRVTGVRVERLQEIKPEDAHDEGIAFRPFNGNFPNFKKWLIKDFSKLWDKIYAKKGYGWDINPWVWVYEFEVVNKEC